MLWSPGMPKCSQLTALRKGGLALFLCVHSQKNVRREEPRWKRALWVSVPLAILNQRNLNGKCWQRGGVGGAGGGAELEVWHVRIREVYKGCIFLDTNVNINQSCSFLDPKKLSFNCLIAFSPVAQSVWLMKINTFPQVTPLHRGVPTLRLDNNHYPITEVKLPQ